MAPQKIEYMCSYCGQKTTRSATMGRPQPGSCRRKARGADGKPKPHSWVINRKF